MPATPDALDDGIKRSKIIRQELHLLSEQARHRYPILAHQDAIGLSIFLGSLAMIIGAGVAYGYGLVPAWAVIISSAFFISLLHELEHDLIHRLFFKNAAWLYNTAMMVVWLVRPNTINPWVRRDWHLHHHRVSGTAGDIEERGLLNGERWGIRRAVMSTDALLAVLLRPFTIHNMLGSYAEDHKVVGADRFRMTVRNFFAYFPFAPVYTVVWWYFVAVHASQWIHGMQGTPWEPSELTASVWPWLSVMGVTYLAPNALRTFCLYFVSSNIHYFGDVEAKNIIQQTQVWTSPWVWPLQAFCFNFGGTHAIHHFAVQYPFYLRQIIATDAHRVMRAHGVRFNDFASMLRSNSWKRVAPMVSVNVGLASAAVAAAEETVWPQAANDV